MAYLERGMPYFVFVGTNAVLVRKIDKLWAHINKDLPRGELPTKSGERGRLLTLSVSLRLPPLPKGEAFFYFPEGNLINFTEYIDKSSKLLYNKFAKQS